MHDPELLILDEPTVGVDPLLRQSIWNHLVQITKDGNKTVIITTHYIEEARQAHTVSNSELEVTGCVECDSVCKYLVHIGGRILTTQQNNNAKCLITQVKNSDSRTCQFLEDVTPLCGASKKTAVLLLVTLRTSDLTMSVPCSRHLYR